MKVRIHRGAHEIGGNCIEIEQGDDRIVLDLGRPLSAAWGEDVPLPQIAGLDGSDPNLLAVVLSHPHIDHYGLIGQVDDAVPVFIGAEAERVLNAAAFFSPITRPMHAAGHLHDRTPIRFGGFKVTPFLADHSAFDAYSLLIESGGRRLFYTGDIRGHGRKSALFDRLIRTPPPTDVLLMEGTNIRADGRVSRRTTERSVEDELVATFQSTGGLVATFSSAQNIDRLVTVYRAARRSGRTLVVDLYTASVATAIGRPSIPQPGFDGIAVYVPNRQRHQVVAASEFERVRAIAPVRVFPEDLAAGRDKYVFLGASSAARELIDAGALHGGTAVWSLWPGYLREPSGQRLVAMLAAADVPLVEHHTSGHAHPTDLQRLAGAFPTARLVPIHSEATLNFDLHFSHVEHHVDGEWWEV